MGVVMRHGEKKNIAWAGIRYLSSFFRSFLSFQLEIQRSTERLGGDWTC